MIKIYLEYGFFNFLLKKKLKFNKSEVTMNAIKI